MRKSVQTKNSENRGVVLPIAALCLTMLLGFAGMAIDLGYLCKSRAEAQNCADAAALAAAAELYPNPLPQTALKLPLGLQLPIYQPYRPRFQLDPAIAASKRIGQANACGNNQTIEVLDSDVSFFIYDRGILVGPPPTLPLVDGLLQILHLQTKSHTFVNSCRVTVRKDALANSPLNLMFAPFLGCSTQTFQCSASAAVHRGYAIGAGDKLLPFAMDITIWNALRFTNSELNAVTLQPLGIDLDSITLSGLLGSNGILNLLNNNLPLAVLGSPVNILDGYTYARGMPTVTAGPDGLLEVVLLADQLHITNKLGILGALLQTVQRVPSLMISLETGSSGDSSPNAQRMNSVIRNGLSENDIRNLSGNLNATELWMPFHAKGYFEIPTACEADLKAIIGQPRIMPLYATLPGTVNKLTDVLGMSHSFKLVGWAGVVVTEVNLSGPVRYINVQPAIYARHSVLPAGSTHSAVTDSCMSDGVYTTPRLIR
ncbi:pilus assembly protein TadG-related protein [Planctomicrobium sp. SH668]|uniref:pilus assembly protein TadG-related protein n=1 Tax=Planctomicrobium sp. SH668 TaxID=3448126 RepID=UPI003F5B5992